MRIIINSTSQTPIYEQIMKEIKRAAAAGEIREGDALPSVRALASSLKISALTVKKAYDALEAENAVITVHGKGSFVSGGLMAAAREDARREVEQIMERAVKIGRGLSMTDEELEELLKLILEG